MNHFLKKTQSGFQMGIAPIDLQTIYTQLDKVGKTYGSQAQLMQVQNAVQDAEKAKHQMEHNEKINSANMPEENDTQRIKDEHQSKNQRDSKKRKSSENDENTEETEDLSVRKSIFQDPNLGQHIDVIG